MTPRDVVRMAIPGAPDELCDHIVWERTAFPFRVSARDIYQAARRAVRMRANGIAPCDWCDRKAQSGKFVCIACERGLN